MRNCKDSHSFIRIEYEAVFVMSRARNPGPEQEKTTLQIENEGQGGQQLAVFTNEKGEEKVVDLTELRDVMRALNFTR